MLCTFYLLNIVAGIVLYISVHRIYCLYVYVMVCICIGDVGLLADLQDGIARGSYKVYTYIHTHICISHSCTVTVITDLHSLSCP